MKSLILDKALLFLVLLLHLYLADYAQIKLMELKHRPFAKLFMPDPHYFNLLIERNDIFPLNISIHSSLKIYSLNILSGILYIPFFGC